jgi:hypothetical protein
MAQTSYEEYLANLMGNVNPQGGMVTGQASAPPPMAMPDISAIQAAVQGVGNVNQGYVAPARTDLTKFRTDFEEGRRGAAEDILAQALGVTPTGGMMSGGDGAIELTDAQKAYFDIETPAERDFRMQQIQQLATPAWLRAILGIDAPVLSGHTDYNIRSEDLKRALAREKVAYDNAMRSSGISWDSNAYGGGGGYVNSEGNAPGASPGEVGNRDFAGQVGYDQ